MAIQRALALACAALFVGACAEIEVSDCEGIDRRSRCEDAEVESGECRWVDVYTPFADAGGCDLGEPVGMCIGLSGTQQGCGAVGCDNGSTPNVYQRMGSGELLEVFVNPECGPEPYGEWESCDGPSCACMCNVDDG